MIEDYENRVVGRKSSDPRKKARKYALAAGRDVAKDRIEIEVKDWPGVKSEPPE